MIYDLVIIGAGPAGLSAAIYAARYKLNFLLVGRVDDSAIAKSHKIENYPGAFSIGGKELVQNWRQQALSLGAKCVSENVISLEKDNFFNIELSDGSQHQSKNIILAMGTVKKKLGVPGEAEFEGSGVSYCAICDAPFFRGRKVAVVGGNDSAAKTALHLADFAEKVYLIYRSDKLRAEPALVEKILNNQKIEIIYNANITEILGKRIVTGVVLDCERNENKIPLNPRAVGSAFVATSAKEAIAFGDVRPFPKGEDSLLSRNDRLALNGVFIEIGSKPNSSFAKNLGVRVDKEGYVKVDAGCATNIEGVYAAGDMTTGSNKFRQIITAAAEGAMAAASVYGEVKKFVQESMIA